MVDKVEKDGGQGRQGGAEWWIRRMRWIRMVDKVDKNGG